MALGVSTASAKQELAATPTMTTSVGIRGGVSVDLDSFNGGLHLALDGVAGIPMLRIEPLIEVGHGSVNSAFGDYGYFLGRIGANAKYFFPLDPMGEKRLHAAAGLSLYYAKADNCSVGGCDATEAGMTIGGGFEMGKFGIDAFIGLGDIPDFTIIALYTF